MNSFVGIDEFLFQARKNYRAHIKEVLSVINTTLEGSAYPRQKMVHYGLL